MTVEETISDVSRKHSRAGERLVVKPYPKDSERWTLGVRPQCLDAIAEHFKTLGRRHTDFS